MPTLKRPLVQEMAAHVFVSDINAACGFYAQLGFNTDFAHGDPPFYAEATNGDARIALRQVCQPVYVNGIREREELLCVSLALKSASDLLAFYAQLSALEISFYSGPTERPWGALDFIVRDPDQNLVLFSGPKSREPATR
jgi:hypothetical protein